AREVDQYVRQGSGSAAEHRRGWGARLHRRPDQARPALDATNGTRMVLPPATGAAATVEALRTRSVLLRFVLRPAAVGDAPAQVADYAAAGDGDGRGRSDRDSERPGTPRRQQSGGVCRAVRASA